MFLCPYSVDNDYYYKKSKELSGQREEIKKDLGIPVDLPVILFLSKLIHRKRPMFLLEVFSELDVTAALVFVGSGYSYNALTKFAKRENIKNVYFFGFQNYSQIPKFYSISDIFAFPSLGESWGLVVNEAMCFGLPIVTTDRVMSSYDLVKNGENGYILAAQDYEGFKDRLKYLIQHPEERKRLGNKSLEIIKDWSYQHYLAGLTEALNFIKNK